MKNKENDKDDKLKAYVMQLTGKDLQGSYSYDPSKVNLFPIGQNYLAVADDTDKLYACLGWDFTDFISDGRIYSYMPVSPEGYKCLSHVSSLLGVSAIDIDCPCPDYNEFSSVPATQQTIDYLRLLVAGNESVEFPLAGVTAVIDDGNIPEIVRLTALYVSRKAFSVRTDTGDNISLVTGHQWNFRPLGMTFLDAVDKIFRKYEVGIIDYITDEDHGWHSMMQRSLEVYNAYADARQRSSSTELPLVNEKGFLITFDDDAVVLAEAAHVPYYQCHTDYLGHLAAFVPSSRLEALTDSDINVRVITPDNRYDLLSLGLTDSILNTKGTHGNEFTDIVITKNITGQYYIHCQSADGPFPARQVSNRLGYYYSTLKDSSREKQLLRNAIACWMYK